MKRTAYALLVVILALVVFPARADKPSKAQGLKRVRQELVKPPFLPKHSIIAKGGPKIIEVRLVVEERKR